VVGKEVLGRGLLVGVGYAEMSLVLRSVGVGVSDERCLPVVVDEGVGEGDVVGCVGNIEETVIVVLVVIAVGREINVVNPDVGGVF
jgi:hypothetical protein